MATDPGRQGGEDTAAAEQHVRAAEENRDALAAQARRTGATAPDETDRPVQGAKSGPAGSGAEGAGAAADATRQAAQNADALRDEARRVEESLPPGLDTGRR